MIQTERLTRTTRQPLVSSKVLAMLMLFSTEIMFFAGLISAYLVAKTNAFPLLWPPPGQPRLPVEATAVNSLFLLFSAWTMHQATRCLKTPDHRSHTSLWLQLTAFLGSLFVLLQGREWAHLIGFGLTTRSSLYGAFFYLIIGTHALHVVIGLILLAVVFRQIQEKSLLMQSHSLLIFSQTAYTVGAMYWYFVVALWPILYLLVYLM